MEISWNISQILIIILFYIVCIFNIITFILIVILNPNTYIITKLIITPIYIITGAMTIICHIKSMLTDNTVEYNYNTKQGTQQLKKGIICSKCGILRPERAHHCSLCNKCILKMDHHCPWINNCVGLKNQKTFILLLIYGILSSLILVILLFPEFINKFGNISNEILNQNIYLPFNITINKDLKKIMINISFGFSIAILLIGSIILYNQVFNVLYNTTSVEYRIYAENITNSPFYSENYKENFKLIFGSDCIHWLIPSEYKNNSIEEDNTNNDSSPYYLINSN